MKFYFGKVLIASVLISGCAGPYSPFGAVNDPDPAEKRKLASAIAAKGVESVDDILRPSISFSPNRMILHGHSKLNIQISDPLGIPPGAQLNVIFNGLDVTDSFHRNAIQEVSTDKRISTYTYAWLRLSPLIQNKIDVYYSRETGGPRLAFSRLDAPICTAFESSAIRNTGGFRVSSHLRQYIEREATAAGFNPGMLAGLIAQESGFENFSVSWAKALGISQITPAAEDTIAVNFPGWPRYQELNQKSVPEIKLLMLLGKVNGGNEWRLDENLSVQGALFYLNWLRRFWSAPENLKLIQQNFSSIDTGLTQLILASYHSGPTRVKRSLQKWGVNWLQMDGLQEARRYINMIFSYCYHFTKTKQVTNAGET